MPQHCPSCNHELEKAEKGLYCMVCRKYVQQGNASVDPRTVPSVFYRVWAVAKNRENPVIWAEHRTLDNLRLSLRSHNLTTWLRIVAVNLDTKEERMLSPDERCLLLGMHSKREIIEEIARHHKTILRDELQRLLDMLKTRYVDIVHAQAVGMVSGFSCLGLLAKEEVTELLKAFDETRPGGEG
jgi:hypothetical protein